MNSEQPRKSEDGVQERSFTVSYGGRFSPRGNVDLMGVGEVSLNLVTGEARFRGVRRAFLKGSAAELSFLPKQRWNAIRRRTCVQFETLEARSGRDLKPFIFWAKSAADGLALLDFLQPPHALSKAPLPRGYFPRPKDSPVIAAITFLLAGLNLAVFFFMGIVLKSGWRPPFNTVVFEKYGANNGALAFGGEWWRLLTSMFMHYGFGHLFGNLFALWFVGGRLELSFGRRIFTVIYFACGLAGGLTSIMVHGDQTWSVGASGAIFGLYGALLGFMLRQSEDVRDPLLAPIAWRGIFFLGINLIYGLRNPAVDLASHGGGFTLGIFLGLIGAPQWGTLQSLKGRARRFLVTSASAAFLIGAGVILATRIHFDAQEEDLLRRQLVEIHQAEVNLQRGFFSAGKPVWHSLFVSSSPSSSGRFRSFYQEGIGTLEALNLRPGGNASETRKEVIYDWQRKITEIDLRTAQAAAEAELMAVDTDLKNLQASLEAPSGNFNELDLPWVRSSLGQLKARADHIAPSSINLASGRQFLLQQIEKTQKTIMRRQRGS